MDLKPYHLHGMNKIMETAAKFFINRDLRKHLSKIQLVTFLEQNHVSFALSPVEYCTALHEENLLVAWEMRVEGICFSLYSQKLTTLVRWYLSLAKVLGRGVEVRLHAPQTKTEHFWLYVWANWHIAKKCIMLGKNVVINGCVWLPKMFT